jgi:hypothetical protein
VNTAGRTATVATENPQSHPRIRAIGVLFLLALVLTMAAGCGSKSEDAEDVLPSPEDGQGQDGPLGAGLFIFGRADQRIADSEHILGNNPLIPWRELEPKEGVYDWRPLDTAIAEAEATGTRIVPRVLTNASLFGQASPDWFFETPDALAYYPSAEAESEGFKAPVAWDPAFQRKFGNFLRALGQRYDGNPTIEFFQTNAGGGLYGEVVLTKNHNYFPPGWTPDVQRNSIFYWLDRWQEAFPRTELSLMVNHVGENIGEDAAAYAADRGVYLQQNTPWLSPEGIALFLAHHDETKIVLEVEDGCHSTGEADFDHLIDTVFGYGFAIDYLHLCGEDLWEGTAATRLSAVWQRLRH